MNRIILIGNGFDLAHGLETSYSHFINHFWKNKIEIIREKKQSVYNDDDISVTYKEYKHLPSYIRTYEDLISDPKINLSFNNQFLFKICNDISNLKWVDIEECYFRFLLNLKSSPDEVKQLNLQFHNLKVEFEKYLTNHVLNHFSQIYQPITIIPEIFNHIVSSIKLKDFNKIGKLSILEICNSNLNEAVDLLNVLNDDKKKLEIMDKYSYFIDIENGQYIINRIFLDFFEKNQFLADLSNSLALNANNILFLNFNYTQSIVKYFDLIENDDQNDLSYKLVNIHGQLNNLKNRIIFGYGDELSNEYKIIENFNENYLLEYVKTNMYLETNNYKKLLEYIDSDLYQIFVMGHSCGNSDRTLLNTIFEHDNCVSIKVFYHQESKDKDNYSDVIRNISRNFTDKKKMRDRVVNKMYCEPLV